MSLARYADPIVAFLAEAELGRRGSIQHIAPDENQVDAITTMLRRGVTNGVGMLRWTLRTPVGVKYDQDTLNQIAEAIEEGYVSGLDPDWRIEIRQ